MERDKRKPWAALVALAVIGGAFAALGATAGHASASRHVVTPMVSIGHNWALEGAVDPASQVGPLRACQTRLTPDPLGACYGPDQIRVAYGIQPLLDQGITGAGRTIVIIDAYGSSTLTADTSLFNAYMGLPATNLNVIYPDGPPLPTDPDNAFGWAAETTLDVTWAHAIAPARRSISSSRSRTTTPTSSARRSTSPTTTSATSSRRATARPSSAWDRALLAQQHKVFAQLAKENITLFASSGDQGAALPSCDGTVYIKAASTPATDPLVTAVGGTQLIAQPADQRPARAAPGSTRSPGTRALAGDRRRRQHRLQPAGLPGAGRQGHAHARDPRRRVQRRGERRRTRGADVPGPSRAVHRRARTSSASAGRAPARHSGQDSSR